MVRAGATIIGERTDGTPALSDDADAFAHLADDVWALPRVISTSDLGIGLAKAGRAGYYRHAAIEGAERA